MNCRASEDEFFRDATPDGVVIFSRRRNGQDVPSSLTMNRSLRSAATRRRNTIRPPVVANGTNSSASLGASAIRPLPSVRTLYRSNRPAAMRVKTTRPFAPTTPTTSESAPFASGLRSLPSTFTLYRSNCRAPTCRWKSTRPSALRSRKNSSSLLLTSAGDHRASEASNEPFHVRPRRESGSRQGLIRFGVPF